MHEDNQSYVDQEEIAVRVSMVADSDARRCLPFERTIKKRIELALQRAGFGVVEEHVVTKPGNAMMLFGAIALFVSGGCAVSYDVQIIVPAYGVAPIPGLALENGGIFTRATSTQTRSPKAGRRCY